MERDKDSHSGSIYIYIGKTFEGHVKLVLRAFSRIFHAKNLSEKNFT